MVGANHQIREFIEASIWSAGSASLVEAMADFADSHHAIPCLSQFNRALAEFAAPLVLEKSTHTLKIGDFGTKPVALTPAEFMSVYDEYAADLRMESEALA
jgi:hypothetical protein